VTTSIQKNIPDPFLFSGRNSVAADIGGEIAGELNPKVLLERQTEQWEIFIRLQIV
jgi:hypothetical protein